MAGSSNSSFNLGGISAEKFKEFNGQAPDTEDQYNDWSPPVGRNGRVMSTNNSPVNTPARAEISNFKDTYNRGLRRSWFETMKVMERACLDDAYTLAVQCPKTAIIQIPIGWNGSPNDIMTSIRVSLARVKVKIDDVVKTLDPLVGGDFRLTAKECQTLFSITFKDLPTKEAVLKLGKIPWFKKARKDPDYSKKGELKIIDLARREITMEVSHYEPELNEQYDKALTDLYTNKCGPYLILPYIMSSSSEVACPCCRAGVDSSVAPLLPPAVDFSFPCISSVLGSLLLPDQTDLNNCSNCSLTKVASAVG